MALFPNWSRETKIHIVGSLTLIFFLMEIIVGYATQSVALVADSFHMLSDLLAICVAYYAIYLAKQRKRSNKLSFGYQRAEILGAFANAIFLLALSFTIIIDAVQRFVTPVEIENPKLVLIVGGVGLTSNILGMVLFGSHVGHDHGSDSGNDAHSLGAAHEVHSPHEFNSHEMTESSHKHDGHDNNNHGHDHGNMNMQGLFLHALGDALGSVGVILSALIIMFADGTWRYYMDPVISLLISGLIIASAVPLVRTSSLILLQGVPDSISLEAIEKDIMALEGVVGVHEVHVWGLSDVKNVASVHVRVLENGAVGYMEVATSIKKLLHGYGIHSTTVQPEFARPASVASDYDDGCLLKCEGGDCAEQVCCSDNEKLSAVIAA
ncbi:hypothetical protein HDU79_010078 [Rhizoclosmatium sp. JEL0117]|nr:hypothetical protein HDU79_010078 [Rhizoclosmatium sp. JEL0117]